MSKWSSGLLAGAATVALCGGVVAAQQTRVRPNDPAAHVAGAGTAAVADKANRSGATAGADADVGRTPEYNAALQKCNAMTGVAKTRCILVAEQKHSASDRTDEHAAGNQAYSAGPQRCDAMSGAERIRCESAVKRKYSHM
jgi:hypothetical protein